MGSWLTRERVQRDVEVLARAGLDTATFLSEVYQSLQRAVPSAAACLATIDPTTQLATAAYKFGELAGENDSDALWGLLEYGHAEPTSYSQLARAESPAVGMQAAMGRDVSRSRRMRELVRGLGWADELRVVAGDGRHLWGGLAMFRDVPYANEEIELVSRLSVPLALGLRVGLLSRVATDPAATFAAGGPTVMIFDADAQLRQASVGAEAGWLIWYARLTGRCPMPSSALSSRRPGDMPPVTPTYSLPVVSGSAAANGSCFAPRR
ncbi:MAG: hypothetical protein ABR564_10215 [Candidatus Dormibacteria bacterium]